MTHITITPISLAIDQTNMPKQIHPTAIALEECTNNTTRDLSLFIKQVRKATAKFGPDVFEAYVGSSCVHIVEHIAKISQLVEIVKNQACRLLVGLIEYALFRESIGAHKLGCFPLSRKNVNYSADMFCQAFYNLCKYQPVTVAIPTEADVVEWIGNFDIREPHKWNICPEHNIPHQPTAKLYNERVQHWMRLYAENYKDSPGVLDMSVCYNDTDLVALREVFTVLDKGVHEASELFGFEHLFREKRY